MGIRKVVDGILLIYFLLLSIAAPLYDSLVLLPLHLYPGFLVHVNSWYDAEFGDYLVTEKPSFFVGLMFLELLVQWPLSIANFYGIVANKSWFNTTYLIYGVSYSTVMVISLSELLKSQKTSQKLLMLYFPFLGFGILAVLRGLAPNITHTTLTDIASSGLVREKKA